MTPRVAGFRLEYPAGFKSECMAGFVGIRNQRSSAEASHNKCDEAAQLRRRTSIRQGEKVHGLARWRVRRQQPYEATCCQILCYEDLGNHNNPKRL
jgi:hypothetical protein